ncbi:MAG: outer membrane protein [Verrucomicrobiales bacterium]|jgi:outer membrane protein
MRTILCTLFISALALVAASAQDLKVGIVDMTRVFQEYHKTKDAEKKVNDGKAIAKKELDERNARYKQLIEKYQNYVEEMKETGISEELRAQKQQDATDVASEARSLEREKKEFAERRQRQLLEQVERMRKAILEEIRELVQDMAKEQNYDLVFDKSGLGSRGIPFLLHSKDGVDFSDGVIKKLNANAPADASAPK